MSWLKKGLKNVSKSVKSAVSAVVPKPEPIERPKKLDFGLDDIAEAAGKGLKNLGEGVADVAQDVGKASVSVAGNVADGLGKAEDAVQGVARKVGKAAVDAGGHVVDEVVDAAEFVGEKTKPVVDKVEDALEPVGEAAGKVLKPVGAAAKDIGEDLVDGVKDAGEAIGDAAKPVVDKVGDVVEPVAEKVGDVLEPVVDKAADVLEPVGEGAMKVLKPVGKGVMFTLDHTFHFLSTGDFGMKVKDLTDEQEAAIGRYDQAMADRMVAANQLISVQSKLKGLSVAYEDQLLEGKSDGALGAPDRVMPDASQRVDPDLYSSDQTDTLEAIGLDPVAKFIKLKNDWLIMMPWEIMWKQDDLAELRRQLRKNIDDFNSATAWLKEDKRALEATKARLEAEIVKVEAEIEAAGLSDEASAVSAMRAKQVEQDTRLSIARTFLQNGLAPEEVAALTGLEQEVLDAIAADQKALEGAQA